MKDFLLSRVNQKLRSIKLDESQDNMTCSRDSINAIPPSDVENLETDVEDDIIVPFANESFQADKLITNKVGGDMSSAVVLPGPHALGRDMFQIPGVHMPIINSQTCFVNGNNNMILNNLEDNFNFNDSQELTTAPDDTLENCNNNSNNMIVNTLEDNFTFNDGTNNENCPQNNRPNGETADHNTGSSRRKSHTNQDETHKQNQQHLENHYFRETTHRVNSENHLNGPSNDKDKQSKNQTESSKNISGEGSKHISKRDQENLGDNEQKSISVKASNQSLEGKHNTQ